MKKIKKHPKPVISREAFEAFLCWTLVFLVMATFAIVVAKVERTIFKALGFEVDKGLDELLDEGAKEFESRMIEYRQEKEGDN